MLIILKDHIKNLGSIGEVVKVKPGYFKNFLQHKGMAVRATRKHLEDLERNKDLMAQQASQIKASAQELANKISTLPPIDIQRNTSEDGKLFGSITQRDISQALAEQNIEISPKSIIMVNPIKNLGEYTIEVYLTSEVSAQLKLNVLRKLKL